MGLFGSGHLRRQIAAMGEELTSLQKEIATVRAENSDIKKQLSDRESTTRDVRDAKKKTDQKLEKAVSETS